MDIAKIAPNYAAAPAQSGKHSPSTTAPNSRGVRENTETIPQHIDMSNVSVNEINRLIRSGVDGLLDVVPMIPPNIINQYGSEYAANIKVDFIGQIETAIEFNKSINKPTGFMENVLENIKSIDGMAIPAEVNVFA